MALRCVPIGFFAGLLVLASSSAHEPGSSRPTSAKGVHVPKVPPGFDPDKMADPAEAKKVAEWLEKEYSQRPQPESVRMLVAILKGSQLSGQDGWFGPAERRFTWEWLAGRHGVDPKGGAIKRETFHGPASLFDRLDRDGDGEVTATDLDWSDRNPFVQQANFVNRLFRRLDASGNGQLTREELDEFFKRAADGKDHVTAEDLRKALIPRGPRGFSPGDAPSVPVLVRGLFGNEIGSLGEGPRLNESAPDFALKTIDGKKTVRLSQLIGPKPVVLVLGNFTCGPFRGLYPDVEAVYRRYQGEATFLMVYVREAHPTTGWKMESNTRVGVAVPQPATLEEREKVCGQFCQKLNPTMPVAVDTIDDAVGNAYSGMPARLYVIDSQGKVAYKGGRGPFGFRVGEMEQALAMALLESAPAKRP